MARNATYSDFSGTYTFRTVRGQIALLGLHRVVSFKRIYGYLVDVRVFELRHFSLGQLQSCLALLVQCGFFRMRLGRQLKLVHVFSLCAHSGLFKRVILAICKIRLGWREPEWVGSIVPLVSEHLSVGRDVLMVYFAGLDGRINGLAEAQKCATSLNLRYPRLLAGIRLKPCGLWALHWVAHPLQVQEFLLLLCSVILLFSCSPVFPSLQDRLQLFGASEADTSRETWGRARRVGP